MTARVPDPAIAFHSTHITNGDITWVLGEHLQPILGRAPIRALPVLVQVTEPTFQNLATILSAALDPTNPRGPQIMRKLAASMKTLAASVAPTGSAEPTPAATSAD